MDVAVSVDEVWKSYRLYHERNQSLKVALLRGRRARYSEFDALKGVAFEIPEGSTFGLIGENGSGKSTLLKCIARILRPDRGSITTRGKVSALLELGAGFHPELSGRENVFLNGAILGLSKRELDARFDDIVGFAGLEQFIDTPVKTYSSGMYVRLGFSVAINVDPDILLIDEVLAVGDEEFQGKCSEKLSELKSSGKTVVVVSHALGAMRTLCDQIALLEHGSLITVGPATDVVDTYLGDVHSARVVDDGAGMRWGSGEARVDVIEILDRDEKPVTTARTGDQVTFRLHYNLDEPLEKLVVGLGVHSIEGHHVTGPNTRDEGLVLLHPERSGYVDFKVPRLLLVPGIYDVSASIFDFACLHPFDFRHRAHRFDVELGEPRDHYGVVSLGGCWEGHDLEAAP
ncbi:MAG: ABC transporter ATP-binding protein [Acidimicrobiia bacterium]